MLDGEIAGERNQTKELPDATAHAEMMAIRRACEAHAELGTRGPTLYSTLQPYDICTMASIWAKVDRCLRAGRDDVHPISLEVRHADTLSFVARARVARRHHWIKVRIACARGPPHLLCRRPNLRTTAAKPLTSSARRARKAASR